VSESEEMAGDRQVEGRTDDIGDTGDAGERKGEVDVEERW
jgi:hypothetical protein